jgi:hypothetical protein
MAQSLCTDGLWWTLVASVDWRLDRTRLQQQALQRQMRQLQTPRGASLKRERQALERKPPRGMRSRRRERLRGEQIWWEWERREGEYRRLPQLPRRQQWRN